LKAHHKLYLQFYLYVYLIYKCLGNFFGKKKDNKIGKKFYKLPRTLPTIGDNMNDTENVGETTTLTPATTKSISMRATVPMSIIKQFNLKAGDKLSWKIDIIDGKLAIIVRPIKKMDK